MDGILLVDKPVGWTSFDVVNKVRHVLRSHQPPVSSRQSGGQATEDNRLATPAHRVRVGHTGTLDPLATGLLVILVGSYTKKAPEFTKLDKVYEVTMKLGETSSTGDSEGIISPFPGWHPGNKSKQTYFGRSSELCQKLTEVMKKFEGEISQTPPAYSAIKINGQRAYKLARAGKEVKLEPRKVKVYSIQLTAYSYPEVKFTAKVSSGTYIRSLAEDIGKELGTGAYMTALRRTEVGKFKIEQATDPNDKNLLQQASQH